MNSIETQQPIFPNWMRGFLLAAAAYNVLWGIFIGWFPETFFQWVTESEAAAPNIIKIQGRAVLFMAAIYFAGAVHPGKFWYFMLFGALTKLVGVIWFYFEILNQEVGRKAIFHLLMNDGIWIPLLIAIAVRGFAYKNSKS